MRSFLLNMVAYVSLYFIVKFFYILGGWNGIYWIGHELSLNYCETVKELNVLKYGTEGQCDGLQIPSNEEIVKRAIKDTFTLP